MTTDKPATGWAMDAAKELLPAAYTTDFRAENARTIQAAIAEATAEWREARAAAVLASATHRRERDEARAAARELGEALQGVKARAKTLRKSARLVGPTCYQNKPAFMKIWQQTRYEEGKQLHDFVREPLAKHAALLAEPEGDVEPDDVAKLRAAFNEFTAEMWSRLELGLRQHRTGWDDPTRFKDWRWRADKNAAGLLYHDNVSGAADLANYAMFMRHIILNNDGVDAEWGRLGGALLAEPEGGG